MQRSVIIVAGGKGLRMGSDLPKQFIPINGKPILMHTLDVFYRWDKEADLLAVIPEEQAPYWQLLCKELHFTVPHRVVTGGETRFHSVYNGLSQVASDGLIAVHDGVRPFVAPDVITACFEMAERFGAAIPVVPMIDTVREIFEFNAREYGNRAIDRTRLRIVQTPQVFRADILRKAYVQPYNELFTDDASAVEASGHPICLIEGNLENIKITTPNDLKRL